MRLYHYTAVYHLPSIQKERVLRVTESNVSLTREHAGPDVVWLTSRESWERPSWAWPEHLVRAGKAIDKGELRIGVDVDDAVLWSEWAKVQGMSRPDRRRMMKTDPHWSEWYVVERPIPESEWLGAEFRPDVFEWMAREGMIPEDAISGQ